MARVKLKILLVVSAALAAPASATGQQIPSPYRFVETTHEAGALGGLLDVDRGQLQLGPDGGIVYGVRYAIEISGPFSIEGVGRLLPTTREVRDPRRQEGDRTIGEADVLLTAVDARLKFSLTGRRTWNGLSPYALAGVGLASDLSGEAADDDALRAADRFEFGTSFLGLLGVGLRWIPGDRWQLRADGSLNLWQLDTPGGWLELESDSETPPPENEWVSGLGLTFGIAYRW